MVAAVGVVIAVAVVLFGNGGPGRERKGVARWEVVLLIIVRFAKCRPIRQIKEYKKYPLYRNIDEILFPNRGGIISV